MRNDGIRKGGVQVSAIDAVGMVADRSVVAVSGFNMAGTPEYLLKELLSLYESTGHPRDIFLIGEALPAIPGRALDAVARELYQAGDRGLLRGVSVPFFGFSPWLQKMVSENMLEAYSWPMGVAAYWFREVASGRPGVVSKIGLETSIDPRKGGGLLNSLAEEKRTCSVRRIRLGGGVYLLYEAPKPNVAFIRATSADAMGNLTIEEEPMRGTLLSIAQATKAHPDPGLVIAQVRRRRKVADPRAVEVPGPFVDSIVVSPARYHWQSGTGAFDPRFSYGMPLSTRARRRSVSGADPHEEVIAKRVLLELVEAVKAKRSPVVVNLGIGIPTLVSQLALTEGISKYVITVLESGQWGGVALPGVNFGIALGSFAQSTMPDMFSNFEGGVIDAASLGFLQVDASGDVNPSMLPGRIYGPGGFPVIAGGSPRVFFAGAFMAGGAKPNVQGGRLKLSDGGTPKFVKKVFRSFFSGRQAIDYNKKVLYITERAVFRLRREGLELLETAPGVDVERDVLRQMGFEPILKGKLREMDPRALGRGRMELLRELA